MFLLCLLFFLSTIIGHSFIDAFELVLGLGKLNVFLKLFLLPVNYWVQLLMPVSVVVVFYL